MPLQPGTNDAAVAENIREMMQAGHPQNQAVAAAMREAGRERPSKDKPKKSALQDALDKRK
jgi:hypothetical protein